MEGIAQTVILAAVAEDSSNGRINLGLADVVKVSSGAFGVVYKAKLYKSVVTDSENSSPPSKLKHSFQQFIELYPKWKTVAVKKVYQDERYKNRELQVLKNLNHPNIIKLKYYFYVLEHPGKFLFLVFKFFPQNLSEFTKELYKGGSSINPDLLKSMMFQMSSALKYIHKSNICHRDIKPHNILYCSKTNLLQISDFGSAKQLVEGQKSVAYICSRHYRAPELILGYTNYTCSIDVWSIGCVMAELMLGAAIFPGSSNIKQLGLIFKILGPPTSSDMFEMNPEYAGNINLDVQQIPLNQLISDPMYIDAVNFLSKQLVYSPLKRITSEDMVRHPYFKEMKIKPQAETLAVENFI